jgi:hypothetical protein
MDPKANSLVRDLRAAKATDARVMPAPVATRTLAITLAAGPGPRLTFVASTGRERLA